jgi:D-aspartate ligase
LPFATPQESKPAIVLTSAGFYGTLAAVRCYGRHGVPVVVADHSRIALARWSRFASSRLRCPPQWRPEELVEWLLEFGRQHPGHVLYATSDETAWIYGQYRRELGQDYRLYQPSGTVIYALLNKRQLDAVGRAEGVAFPRTWFPETEHDLQQVAREARFPVLVKPVTQILHSTHSKGEIARDASELAQRFAAVSRDSYAPAIIKADPSVVRPIVQEFEPEASRDIYSLSGFIDESGEILGVRAAIKVLQRPRRTGVGLCFAQAEVKPELLAAVTRIAKRVGYYGVFEVEFIRAGGRYLLIDFNPRFYGQMGFDIGRNFPVPLLAYNAALGNQEALKHLSTSAQSAEGTDPEIVYCHRIELELFLRAQRLSGGLTSAEVRYWRRWSRGRAIDAVIDSDDWKPVAAEAIRNVLENGRHPRVFLRTMMAKSVILFLNYLHMSSGSQ